MSEVILVRPGHTDFDEQQRIQGRLSLPLNDRGRRHVEEVARGLELSRVEMILTGPGEPTRATADLLGRLLGVPVKEKEELRNLDQGLWQGLPLDEVRKKYPKLLKQWHDNPEVICPPQGEPVCEALSRLRDVLKKPLKKYNRLLVVAAEPLATLIAAVVRGNKPEFSGPTCSHAGPCVQRIYPGEAIPAAPLLADAVAVKVLSERANSDASCCHSDETGTDREPRKGTVGIQQAPEFALTSGPGGGDQ